MAIVRVVNDGPRDHVVHITGVAAESTTINPATMSVGGAPDGKQTPNDLAISEIWYGADALNCQIFWDATADELAWIMNAGGAYYVDFRPFGDLPNRAGAGKTGSAIVTSIGTPGSYSIVIHFKKKYP